MRVYIFLSCLGIPMDFRTICRKLLEKPLQISTSASSVLFQRNLKAAFVRCLITVNVWSVETGSVLSCTLLPSCKSANSVFLQKSLQTNEMKNYNNSISIDSNFVLFWRLVLKTNRLHCWQPIPSFRRLGRRGGGKHSIFLFNKIYNNFNRPYYDYYIYIQWNFSEGIAY